MLKNHAQLNHVAVDAVSGSSLLTLHGFENVELNADCSIPFILHVCVQSYLAFSQLVCSNLFGANSSKTCIRNGLFR